MGKVQQGDRIHSECIGKDSQFPSGKHPEKIRPDRREGEPQVSSWPNQRSQSPLKACRDGGKNPLRRGSELCFPLSFISRWTMKITYNLLQKSIIIVNFQAEADKPVCNPPSVAVWIFVNRYSERIPRCLRRGLRANQKQALFTTVEDSP